MHAGLLQKDWVVYLGLWIHGEVLSPGLGMLRSLKSNRASDGISYE